MNDKLLRYRFSEFGFSEKGWPPDSRPAIHSVVTTRYDPDQEILKIVSFIHEIENYPGEVDEKEGNIDGLDVKYTLPSLVCPECNDDQPVLIWTGKAIEPVSGWDQKEEVDVLRS